MQISVETNIAKATAMLEGLRRDQVPFATAYALTQVAKSAQREVEKEINRVFDRPTRYTQKAVYVQPALKTRLYSLVKIKDDQPSAAGSRGANGRQIKYLTHNIEGGTRGRKPHENLLIRAGHMPAGWYAIPGNSVKLDAYGNMPASMIGAILSQLRAHSEFSASRNETAKTAKAKNSGRSRSRRVLSRYFSAKPGNKSGLHPGIYERMNLARFVGPTQRGQGSIRPVLIFTPKAPKYRQRLKFDKIVYDTVQAQFGLQFRRGFALADRTKR